ncbi:unnamed protein product [Adineta ricciae]|uniref:Uncharacterized protein n=1 Tax=Adineta ricciae TaxID=249248 RepID=A0A813NV73_ADIRI|nr:unnamed protein product [Adineta ricciae]CAF1502391.1 unnamed protein product [Adineta ricciae]
MQHIIDRYYNLSSIHKALVYDQEWFKETKTTRDTTKSSTLTGDLTKSTSKIFVTKTSITSQPAGSNLSTNNEFNNALASESIVSTTSHQLVPVTDRAINSNSMTTQATTSATRHVDTSKTTEISVCTSSYLSTTTIQQNTTSIMIKSTKATTSHQIISTEHQSSSTMTPEYVTFNTENSIWQTKSKCMLLSTVFCLLVCSTNF